MQEQTKTIYVGVCKAPPLPDALLQKKSTDPTIVALQDLVKKARAEKKVPLLLIPMSTLDAWQAEFDNLTGTARNEAFHLVWYAKELALGRYPG